MPARTNATPPSSSSTSPPTSSQAGILRPDELARYSALVRTPAHPEVANWVENHWTLAWQLPAGTWFDSQTLPHPACNLSIELGHPRQGLGEDRVVITGVPTRRFDVRLAGAGWVHAVKFRPGGLAALVGLDAATLTDRTVPASGHVPPAVVSVLRTLDVGTDPAQAASRVDEALAAVATREPDPAYDELLALIADMLEDRSLLTVAAVQERHGIGTRRLQRLFARYVGASPKWVLGRYRMHDVVTELDAGYTGTLADLAAVYGWYDQAHFTRDFTRLIGVTPGEYRSR